MNLIKNRALILEEVIKRSLCGAFRQGGYSLCIQRDHMMTGVTDQNTMMSLVNLHIMIITKAIEWQER